MIEEYVPLAKFATPPPTVSPVLLATLDLPPATVLFVPCC